MSDAASSSTATPSVSSTSGNAASSPRPVASGLSNLLWIALASFRETVRDKILYTLLFFVLALFAFSMLLGQWSVFAAEKVIKDFSLGVMSLGGLFIAIFVGIGLIQKEIQRRTIFTLLSKPIPRWQILVGKYLGLLLVVTVNIIVMMIGLYTVLWLSKTPLDPRLWWAAYATFWEMAVVIAVALLFSTFSTPVTSSLLTFAVYVAGHLSGDLLNYIETMARNAEKIPGAQPLPDWFKQLATIVYYAIPNLELFNVRAQVVHGLALPPMYFVWSSLHGLGWSLIFLAIASVWFSRRDFV